MCSLQQTCVLGDLNEFAFYVLITVIPCTLPRDVHGIRVRDMVCHIIYEYTNNMRIFIIHTM
jgi:hypothetical protein